MPAGRAEPPSPSAADQRRLRLTLEFDGTAFLGWQRQAGGERTVQATVEGAFAALPGEHSSVLAAGRTDAGVHALAMVAHVDTTWTQPNEKLRLALNAHLPPDVKVVRVADAAPDFQAQFHCLYRRYLYRMRVMRDDPRGIAIQRERVLAVHRHVDLGAMAAATRHLLGTHDFSTFATQETRSTVRTVHLCELRLERGEVRLHIAADGFLRNMVRTIVGTLLWVGKGKLAPSDMPALLAARDRRRAGHNVGPQGLYFAEAGYAPWDPVASERAVRDLVV
ncbi:MAG: tRNA pseudouridine(38-40) synthase TruA [Trueperaceae bacterium]|nr:tRNA pseudouridine(38-40) synthase TruA [Trueperaceae bacterium]MCC6309659.1 tRNA pseudouridine(38-40) synthase TruA [Trueperaceae bacterium]MCO5172913.1 tRNA pseudouridine(38-40) synthase TruA [Trueperaceae bacterium]